MLKIQLNLCKTYILQRNNEFDGCSGTKDGTKDGKIYGERYNTLKKDPVKLNSVPYKYNLKKKKKIPDIVEKQARPQ